MNILYLAHRIPYPPNKGDKLRAWRQLERLAQHHRVWCACFVDCADDLRHVDVVRGICIDMAAIRLRRASALARGVAGLLGGGTVTEGFFRHGAMGMTLSRWTQRVRFDAVVAFSSSMAPYALAVPAGRRVLDLCDLDSEKWLAYAGRARFPMNHLYRTEGQRLAARERHWLGAFDAVTVVTEPEAAPLRDHPAAERLFVVGNGVDVEPPRDESHTPPGDDGAAAIVRHQHRRKAGATHLTASAASAHPGQANPAPVIGFVGVMDYTPNIDAVCWFVRCCWPAIRAAVPGASFRIVGRNPTRAVRRLSETSGVVVVGEVENVSSELAGFDISVAPLRMARGIQNKVLEAMAAGKPVVLSSPAATGLTAEDGRHLLIADGATATANAIIRLSGDAAFRRALGGAAREFVRQQHRWDRALDWFELIVAGAARPFSSASVTMAAPAAVPAPSAGPVPSMP